MTTSLENHSVDPTTSLAQESTPVLPYYEIVGKEVEVFEHAFQNKLPLLLKGPTGSGKSRFVEYMAAKMGLPILTVCCHEETSAVDLVGRYLIQGSDTVWQDGPLTRAVREGCVLYIDEIAEARPDTIVALHSLTDYRRKLYLERHAEEIEAHPHFMLVASFNPGYQSSWKELKPSTRQRFLSMSFDYPQAHVEKKILENEASLPSSTAGTLVKLAQKLRNLSELSVTETVSTRLLVDAGKLIASGLPPRLACEVGIAEPLSDDEEIVKSIKDLIALHF